MRFVGLVWHFFILGLILTTRGQQQQIVRNDLFVCMYVIIISNNNPKIYNFFKQTLSSSGQSDIENSDFTLLCSALDVEWTKVDEMMIFFGIDRFFFFFSGPLFLFQMDEEWVRELSAAIFISFHCLVSSNNKWKDKQTTKNKLEIKSNENKTKTKTN